MNKYVTVKRFKQVSMSGEVNIPAQTACTENGNIISCLNKPLCYATSENGHTYFAIDNDGKGKTRGLLIQQIKDLLKRTVLDSESSKKLIDNRWDAVWESDICRPYKRKEFADHWLWNHDFYLASIETLTQIYELILSVN